MIDNIFHIITKAKFYSIHNIYLIGDSNTKHQEWCTYDATSSDGKALKNFFDCNDFSQLIDEPTRFGNTSHSCIDHIFTNSTFNVNEFGTLPKDSCFDHCPIYFRLYPQTSSIHTAYKRTVWNYKNANFLMFRISLMNVAWNTIFTAGDINEITNNFMNLLTYNAKLFIPCYETTIRPRDKPWFNSEIRRLMRTRNRLHSSLKNKPQDIRLQNKFKTIRNKTVSEIRSAKINYQLKQFETVNSGNPNSKTWWQTCKALLYNKPVIKAPLNNNGSLVTDNKHKADIFNRYFVEQSTLDTSAAKLPQTPPRYNATIYNITTNPLEVYKTLNKLKPGKATGPDNISNRILTETSSALAEPLSILFNKCIAKGTFPDAWKQANVIPLFKKGDMTQCNNYRPVSLLPCISKVFEKIIFQHLFSYLKNQNIISSKQSGFIPGDSTTNQLSIICHNIYSALDSGDEVHGVFLDFSKAFDKVWHTGLLYKLKRYGVAGNILELIKSYLKNRKQRVLVNNTESSWLEITAGVPQGSVLGPLLFLIYINDICNSIESDLFLFADDCSLFQKVNCNRRKAAKILNRDLAKISKWCRDWLLTLSPSKSATILFSRKNKILPYVPVLVNNTVIKQVDSHKHLGIVLNKTLSWSDHINEITTKAMKRVHLLRLFKYKMSRSALHRCYLSFIRPLLEYGDVVFDNCSQNDKNTLENIQYNALRLITGCKKGTSRQLLLEETGLCTLQTRRTFHKILKFHSIVFKTCPVNLHTFLTRPLGNSRNTTRARGEFKYLGHRCRTSYFRYSFFPSSTHLWNLLPSSIRCCSQKALFKCKLTDYLKVKTIVPKHFYIGNRLDQINLCQMRLNFSSLNGDLYNKSCIPSPMCTCGPQIESARHYFFQCSNYTFQRETMLEKISPLIPPEARIDYELLVSGSFTLPPEINIKICHFVLLYINETSRFGM